MILNIYGKIPSEERLLIRVNGETKILDTLDSHVSFIINEKKNVEINIEQQISKSNRKPLFLLFFLITAIVQGAFNILMMNTDSKWYRKIKAYCLNAKLVVDMQKDTDVHFSYTNSKHDEMNQKWGLPVFKAEPSAVSNVDFVLNHCDFKNQYFNFVKRMISVAAILMCIFIFLLYFAITNLNIFAIILLSALMLGVIFLVIVLSIRQHKKLKELYQSFLKQNEID